MGLERIFLQLLNMSITAGYVIIAVLLIRLCIRRLPKIYSYILWSVVAFRLLCPFSLSSAYSFFNLNYFNEMEKTETGIQYVTTETESEEGGNGPVMINGTALPSVGAALDEPMEQGAETAVHKKDFKEHLPQIFSVVWIFGIGVLLIYSFLEIMRVKKQTADAVLAEGNIYESDRICQPFVFGMIHPRIYIPFRLQGEEREYILGHEQYHIRRKDYLVKGIAYLIAVVYWFHPLVWAAYYFMCQDMEMSCDEKVISSHGNGIKQSYGRLLLSFATGKRRLAGPLNFGESNAGKRIKNVLKYKKTGVMAAVLGVVLLAGLCLVFATNGKSRGNQGTNSVNISATDEQPVLSSMILPEGVKGEFEFTDKIESYLVYADIYKAGAYEGRRVIVSHDMTAYKEEFCPVTGFWVNEEGGDTEGEQSSIVVSYNTGVISRVSNIPISEKVVAVASDTLWMDGKFHEIQADTPYIYMAKYMGYGDINQIECFRCENLNQADEEEWNRCINQECITVLLYFVFSEKPEKELFKEYGDVESPNDMFARNMAENDELEEGEPKESGMEEARERETAENAAREAQEQLEAADGEADLSRVMDRIVEKYWGNESDGHVGDYTWNDFLMECKAGNEDILWEDHLVYFDGADGAGNERADVYGVISPEFGMKGIIIDYKERAEDSSNTNYFDWNWDVLGFCPQLEMADFDKDGREEIFFRLCGQKDPDNVYRERLFVCETYETCTVEPYELTSEMIDDEVKNLLEAEVIEDERRVKISEKGTDSVLISKLFYPGNVTFDKILYSDWNWITYDEDTNDIFLVLKPTVYVSYNNELEAGPARFTTENELLGFKVRYDYSSSLESGYFTLTNPSRRSDISE